MGIYYRNFKKMDASLIATLSEDEWKYVHEGNANILRNSPENIVHCHIAEENNKIIGYIYGFILPSKTLIPEFLYVCPQYRGTGVGQQLCKNLEKNSKCNISQIYYNTGLHKYYANQGYDIGCNLEVAVKSLA